MVMVTPLSLEAYESENENKEKLRERFPGLFFFFLLVDQ